MPASRLGETLCSGHFAPSHPSHPLDLVFEAVGHLAREESQVDVPTSRDCELVAPFARRSKTGYPFNCWLSLMTGRPPTDNMAPFEDRRGHPCRPRPLRPCKSIRGGRPSSRFLMGSEWRG